MVGDPLGTAIGRLLRQVSAGPSQGATDAELLERFVRLRDEAALETLLWRHGPMVLNTCRRLLGHWTDSEDCFQATFLVLCRRAGTISKRQSLGSWLHKVAYRICLRVRVARARQPVGVAAAPEPSAPVTVSELERRELRAVLDEELSHLAEKYRAPLVLHYLEGKTVEQAARELGWRQGTVCSRLARGKDLLGVRLSKRGVTLSAGTLAAALAQEAAGALPPGLPQATVQGAAQFAGRALVSPSASRMAAALAHGFLRAEFLRRLGWLLVVLAVGVVGAGAAIALSPAPAKPPIGQEGPATNLDALQDLPDLQDLPVLRDGFGDPLPAGAVGRLGTVRFRHGAGLLTVAYSPDGSTLASAGAGGTIRLWDAATGMPRGALHQPSLTAILTLAFSPDGLTLATGGFVAANRKTGGEPPSPLALWDVRTGRRVRTLTAPGTVYAVAFSPDGRTLGAGGAFDAVLLWDTATGATHKAFDTPRPPPVPTIDRPCVRALAFSPDGQTLVAGGKSPIVRRWDLARGAEGPPLTGNLSSVSALTFSPDGTKLFCAQYGTIGVWDLAAGQDVLRTAWEGNGEISGMALAADGCTVAAALNGGVQLVDTVCGRGRAVRKAMNSPGGHCFSLGFSPDGKSLAGADTDGEILLWDPATAERIRPKEAPPMSSCWVAVSPDGATLATASRAGTALWEANTARLLQVLGGGKGTAWTAFSPDGKQLTYGPEVFLRDLTTRVPVPLPGKLLYPRRIVFAPDGKHLALLTPFAFRVYQRKQIQGARWEESHQHLWAEGADTDSVETLAFSPDSHQVGYATGRLVDVLGRPVPPSERPRVVVKETATGRPVCELPCSARCRQIAFAPAGRTLAAACDDGIHLWDTLGWQPLGRLEERPATRPQERLLDPDLRPLRYESLPPLLCDVLGGSVPEVENRHYRAGEARVMAFAPDGRTLAAESPGNRIMLWDVVTRRALRMLRGHEGPIRSLAFTPDGRRLISGSDDTTGLIWDLALIMGGREPR
jgi:RNA polymerase sigma factor (sigma-70 family)